MQLADINQYCKDNSQTIKIGIKYGSLQGQDLDQTILRINQQAYHLFQKKQLVLALKKLKEGQDMLEYAAESCCKIKRDLIIAILHNIVCITQHLADLKVASNYLQGLIYNHQINNSSKANSRLIIQDTPTSASLSLLSQDNLAQTQLAKYYLQYCAINSQLRNHRNAQLAAKKSIGILTYLLKESQLIKSNKMNEVQQFEAKKNILKSLIDRYKSGINDKEHISNFILMFEILWKNEVNLFKRFPIQSQLKVFSIGNVMILDYKHINGGKIGELYKTFYYQFILMSISLFSLATEVRLQGEEKIAEAKHYHSLSILFYFVFVPFDSPYIHHIKDNYIKNYGYFTQTQISFKITYKNMWIKIKKDSILESSINLQQQSVNTEQQQRRKQRLKKQNQKLKHICQAQHKPKNYIKSYQKSKSLTISHSNAKKISVQSRQFIGKKQNFNNTNPHLKTQMEDYYYSKPFQTKKLKQQKQNRRKDDMGQKYFEMAFKKQKFKSPTLTRKNSIRSNSSTKSNDFRNSAAKRNKQKMIKGNSKK